jgi:hypothetical protein
MHRTPLHGSRGWAAARQEPERCGRSHAFDSPLSGEHTDEAYTPNAATRSRGWSASEAGQRSIAV